MRTWRPAVNTSCLKESATVWWSHLLQGLDGRTARLERKKTQARDCLFCRARSVSLARYLAYFFTVLFCFVCLYFFLFTMRGKHLLTQHNKTQIHREKGEHGKRESSAFLSVLVFSSLPVSFSLRSEATTHQDADGQRYRERREKEKETVSRASQQDGKATDDGEDARERKLQQFDMAAISRK